MQFFTHHRCVTHLYLITLFSHSIHKRDNSVNLHWINLERWSNKRSKTYRRASLYPLGRAARKDCQTHHRWTSASAASPSAARQAQLLAKYQGPRRRHRSPGWGGDWSQLPRRHRLQGAQNHVLGQPVRLCNHFLKKTIEKNALSNLSI